ncbi:ketopantoate reductase family protein [Candidatus Oscillochloris fontis]|uniref:ketopantoate reductase family protein n=1 Tax=Candidatus Oscillochloris fontis TaxID=2496868 RepID=UPI00101D375E|nr:2-dehydropantoate 2-reductase [Candidatus Oscillochloris fontis]
MSIVIVGGGAIGLLVAGRLSHAGVQPTTLLARPSSMAALATQSLSITQQGQTTRLPGLRVVADPAACAQPDLAILCVKGYDTPGAVATLQALNPSQILTLQNGIGNEEILIDAFGAARVISGAITTSVDLLNPTTISVTKAGGIGLAPTAPGGSVQLWAKALAGAGFRIATYPNHRSLKWSKALLNMLGNASAAILGMSVAEVYADSRLIALERRAYREALAVMQRIGASPINLPSYPAASLSFAMTWLPRPLLFPILRKVVAGGRGGKAPSLLRDLRAGRSRSEGEFLYGAIAATAAQQGIAAPVNAGLWRVLGGIAAGMIPWEEYRGRPEKLLMAVERS